MLHTYSRHRALDDSEMDLIKRHPLLGSQALAAVPGVSAQMIDVVLHHHEYLDGTGYPHGLKGSEISDLLRILTIADIFGALIERRSYKPPLPAEVAYQTLLDMGPKLDKDLVREFHAISRVKLRRAACPQDASAAPRDHFRTVPRHHGGEVRDRAAHPDHPVIGRQVREPSRVQRNVEEGHPVAGGAVATLRLAHRTRAYPAATDGVATAHSYPLPSLTTSLTLRAGLLHTGLLPAVLLDQQAKCDDAQEPQDPGEDSYPVQVPLDHGR